MNYVWEAILRAEKSGREREKLRFLEADNPSPYIEVAFEDINTSNIENNIIYVNPLYRFSDIFGLVLDKNIEELEETRKVLFDILFHYIAQMDLRSGLCKQEYYIRFLLKEMLVGKYGKQTQKAIRLFRAKEQRTILSAMLELYRAYHYIRVFRKIMRTVYEKSIVYVSNDISNEVLLYIGREETTEEKIRIMFLVETFLPINYHIRLFWNYHFGIIDVDETMRLEEIMIF